MSAQAPSGPAQPRKSESYTATENPVSRTDSERAAMTSKATERAATNRHTDTRGPWSGNHDVEGAPQLRDYDNIQHPTTSSDSEEHATSYRAGGVVQNENVDAEQMAPPSEGKVAEAVERKSGTQRSGDEHVHFDDYASGLDRKKREQARARNAAKEARRAGVDIDDGSAKRKPRAEMG